MTDRAASPKMATSKLFPGMLPLCHRLPLCNRRLLPARIGRAASASWAASLGGGCQRVAAARRLLRRFRLLLPTRRGRAAASWAATLRPLRPDSTWRPPLCHRARRRRAAASWAASLGGGGPRVAAARRLLRRFSRECGTRTLSPSKQSWSGVPRVCVVQAPKHLAGRGEGQGAGPGRRCAHMTETHTLKKSMGDWGLGECARGGRENRLGSTEGGQAG